MAVTKQSLAALTSAALILPGMQSKSQAAEIPDVQADFDFAYYNEGGERMNVEIYQLSATSSLTENLGLRINGIRDVISGASPIYNRPVISQPQEMSSNNRQTMNRSFSINSKSLNIQTRSGASGSPEPVPPPQTQPNPPTQPQPPDSGGNPPITPQPPGTTPVTPPGSSNQIPDTLNPNDVSVEQVISAPVIFDERYALDAEFSYAIKDFLVGFGGGISRERDYKSNFGSLNLQYELNNKLTSLSAGFSYASDEVEPVARDFTRQRNSQQYLLGASHVLTKNTVVQTTLTYSRQSGYLDDPYKRVFFVDGGVFDENRPDTRDLWSVLNRFTQYVPYLDASAHLDYRYFSDSWGIKSHTFEFTWYQPLGQGWALRPRIRYYSQTQADFYQPFFIVPGEATYFASDYRLAEFGAISGGISLSKVFKGNLKLQAGVEYYDRKANYSLTNNGNDDSFADYNFTLVSASISYKF